jgi:hypothetical protein
VGSVYIPISTIPNSSLYTVNVPDWTANTFYPEDFLVDFQGKRYRRRSSGTSLTTFRLDFANWAADYTNASFISPLDVGAVPGDEISNSGVWGDMISALSTSAVGRRVLVLPAGLWGVTRPLIIPMGYSVKAHRGAIIQAQTGFTSVVSNGKTVRAVVSTATDSAAGYWEEEIDRIRIDANNIAEVGLELWRFRFARLDKITIFGAINNGLRVNSVTESTSYQTEFSKVVIFHRDNVFNVAGQPGIELQRCTDIWINRANIVGYDVGLRDDSTSGANEYDHVHVWTRPPQGNLTTAFHSRANSCNFIKCYADSPSLRNPGTFTSAAGTARGFLIEASGITLEKPKVFVNDATDGNGYAYGFSNQVEGIRIENTAGSCVVDTPRFIGSTNATMPFAFSTAANNNNGATVILNPIYDTTARVIGGRLPMRIQPGGVVFKSSGAPIWYINPRDRNYGGGFGSCEIEMDSVPQSNGPSTFEAYTSLNKNVGTTGRGGVLFWDMTSDGGATPSARCNHGLLNKGNISYLAHSQATESPTVVIGRQDALEQVNSVSARASAGGAVLDVDRPSSFNAPVYLPRYTTAEKLALGSAAQSGAIVFDTTLGAISSFDGTNWRNY